MGALGKWLEEDGIATTQISLVREHTAAIRPPRALWVPFILGRPLGVPQDAAFQRRVLMAALKLLEIPSGPVLVDYAEDAPVPEVEEAAAFACPVSFKRPVSGEGMAAAVSREVADLAPWYDVACNRRGRTTAALSGLSPADAARFITDFIGDPATPPYREGIDAALALRLATQDLKAYYLEAVAAQPGPRAALDANRWFWQDTAAGKAYMALREACLKSGDDAVRRFGARSLIPVAVAPRPSGIA